MQKLAKKISVLMAAVMTLSLMLNFVMAAPAKAATTYPQVQYATEPKLEYEAGDIVNFDLYTPNYGGRVQYRVVLWNDETKSYRDLWNTPDRYYANWMPYGNNIFNLHWKIDEPGHYRITIYAKRAGVPNNQTYLLGKNCDSFMESDSFVVKAKTPVATPDIPSDTLKLAAKSTQMVVGQQYEVKANVGKAGVKVIFNVDAAGSSINKDIVGEAVSDANGIATYKYTRNAADADYVTAYVAAKSSVRDAEKVFWGVTPILTIEAMDKDDAANITNGGIKQYKVKLTNPVTGQPMRYKELKIMLKENIDTVELKSNAVVTNDFNGVRVTPYQRMNNIVPGGLNEVTASIVTNDNGEATFTVTGYNTKATPIVFYDNFQFFNQLPNISLADWNLQIPAPVVLPDSSQFEPAYAGNYNGRLDATELQVQPKTVSFVMIGYTFESVMDGDKYVAVTDMYRWQRGDDSVGIACEDQDDNYRTGRKFTVTVKKPDGTPFAGGFLMVRLEQLFDNNVANDCDARILVGDALYESVELELNKDGKAKFYVISDELNDIATPRVWIDQDSPNYPYSGERDHRFTADEPTKVLDTLYFVNRAVNSADFVASIPEEYGIDEDYQNTDADGNLINLGGYYTDFTFTIFDQNNNDWIPEDSEVLVTYNITNNGRNIIYIPLPSDLDNVKVNREDWHHDDIELLPNDSITIAGTTDYFETYLQAKTLDNTKSGKITIQAHAVVTKDDDAAWWWNLPTNTTNAVVGNATVKASWVNYTDMSDLEVAKEVTGTVEFVSFENEFVVIKTSGGSYYMVDYGEATKFYTAREREIAQESFEDMLDLDIKLYVYRNDDGSRFEINFVD